MAPPSPPPDWLAAAWREEVEKLCAASGGLPVNAGVLSGIAKEATIDALARSPAEFEGPASANLRLLRIELKQENLKELKKEFARTGRELSSRILASAADGSDRFDAV